MVLLFFSAVSDGLRDNVDAFLETILQPGIEFAFDLFVVLAGGLSLFGGSPLDVLR